MTSDNNDTSHDPLQFGGSVWFRSGEQALGGAQRIALLAAIGETGSITAGARAVGMSYKAAWDAVDAMNNLAGETLVIRSTGGKGGGGTTLTPRALTLIDTFRAVDREHRLFLERAGAAIARFSDDWQLIGRIGMKTSARNQLYGKVSAIQRGTVNDEIALALPGGQRVVAIVTHESTETLALAVGAEAVALVKASSVLLVADDGTSDRLSTRNRLRGTVSVVQRGALNAEVSLTLEGGAVVTSVVTNESVAELGVAEGQVLVAAFKASSVILGVTA
ncbi:TOBE domain-containing protein [Paraburkholderia phymatum]|uniref:Transcriptional regulator, ModE family n=1 Tax=Paraburkholderia phymatum (strain DSM 17167 / CIP 108236 / LMG 21445 / STM815) TaxID=391038 RepID=B2JQH5_PARP8|nr:TOBE domain-containing protein [Paraburkholderia phymatum]ACC73516.1 transcriptional regulator, ModE family [Paraburkholderia phymatum STM815]